MKRLLATLALLLAMAGPACAQFGNPEVRIKDIAHVQGVSSNFLVGYGLIVGLANSGDSAIGVGVTNRTISNMLERMGAMQIPPGQIRARNVAAVLVTATMAPYSKAGDVTDVTVSSMGDARSLQGGTLILTQLKGADNSVYALAQGPITTGGMNIAAGGLNMQKNHELAGRVPGGCSIVRDVPELASQNAGQVTITMNEPDATTASKMAQAIRDNGLAAEAVNPATIRVEMPQAFAGNAVDLVARIEQVTLRPDRIAKVIINERTGTVVMGGDVKLGPVALAHGNLRLVIQAAQAYGARGAYGAPGTTGASAYGPPIGSTYGAAPIANGVGSSMRTASKSYSVMQMSSGTTLRDIADALNAIGVTPRDLIAIVQALKQAGALDAVVQMQ